MSQDTVSTCKSSSEHAARLAHLVYTQNTMKSQGEGERDALGQKTKNIYHQTETQNDRVIFIDKVPSLQFVVEGHSHVTDRT